MGELDEELDGGKTVVLRDARNCVHWSTETRGCFGLASHGPKAGSKIGPVVPRIKLRCVTSLTDCTDDSVAAWEKEPWS
jgi:hypothetical protein